MSSSSLLSVYEAALKLDIEDQKLLVANLIDNFSREKLNFTRNELFVYDAIGDLDVSKPPIYVFVKTYGVDKYRSAAAFLHEYLKLSASRSILQPLCYYSLFFKLLAENIRDRDIPVTVKTLIDGHTLIPSLIDLSFPGYARAKMLDCIIRRSK